MCCVYGNQPLLVSLSLVVADWCVFLYLDYLGRQLLNQPFLIYVFFSFHPSRSMCVARFSLLTDGRGQLNHAKIKNYT